MIRRVLFVLRMMFGTAKRWPISTWFGFWLGGRTSFQLEGVDLQVRSSKYFSKLADLAMAWEVLVDGVYDTYPISDGDVVVDVGGHIGSFSVKTASKSGAAKIYTCEPFPPTFDILRSNTEKFDHVEVSRIAISNRSGTDTLYFSEANPAENSLVRKTDNSIDVSLMTLEEFLDSKKITNVDLLKLDCEGAEFEILHASENVLGRIQKMVMEVHEPEYFNINDKYSINGLVDFLSAAGFAVKFERENKFQGYIFATRS